MSSTTAVSITSSTSTESRQEEVEGRARTSVAPVLDARDSRSAGALASIVGPRHPVRTFAVGVVLAYALIAGVSIVLGLLVTRVLIASRAIAGDDEYLVRVLSHHRSAGLTEASLIGSMIAGWVVLAILVGVFAVAAAAFRQWRVAAFVVFALAIELAAYTTTTLVIHRARPPVHRLELLPVHASYPSGHTAAAIAAYCGLALLLTSRVAGRFLRSGIWAVAVAIAVFVAWSRMYRGMHHPLDVLGGVAIGVGTLLLMVIVCRAAGTATRRDASMTHGG